jgi:PAS domain S-box-containing protein
MLDAAIRVAGNVVGVVCLEHTGKSRIWGPDEIGFVRELAAHVGKLLTEADRQHSEKVRELVYDITRASNTARDHSELFLLIKEKLASVIDTTNFFIVLYDKEKDTLTLPYFVDEKDSFTTIPARKTLTAHMIHLGVPLLVSEDDTRELVAKGLIDMVGTPSKSWLGIPLKVAEEIIGAVVVQSYTDSVTYTDNDLEILQFVSEQIAIAIHRRGTEEGLMREKAHLEELLESSPEAIVLTDNSGRVQRINGEFSRLFGYQEEEAVGRYIDNLVADGDQYQEASDNTRQVAQGERVVAETIRYHKDKSPIHVSILGTPIRIQDGQIAIFSIYRDIGERKRAELQIREKSQQLFYEKQLWEDTFDAMAEGISVHDENYRITRVNAALCRLLGKSREDILGKHCYQVFHNRDRQPPFCPMKRSLAERTQATEEIFEPSLGKYLLISSSPILGNEEEGGEKRLLGVIHSVQDITVLKEREKKLEELNVELKAADKQKSEFVSIVSHDFGNPLGVIQGNVELMLLGAYGELEPKMKTKLETIQNTTKRLNKLRTDTLDLAKMDLGQMELEPRNDDLEKLVRAALEQTLPMAEKKGQTIEFQDPGSFILNYDSARIFQVVDNYLSNAVRYTPEGGFIQLTLQELGSEIMFCVKDDGRGIPEDELENVFRRFYRVGERVQGSTGLGLSIVKGIILAHGGRCWAESDGLGRGTTFCFALPKN